MELSQLSPLLYLSVLATLTCARNCDVTTCAAGQYYDLAYDGCRACKEMCGAFYEGRVIECNNLCRTYCDDVTSPGKQHDTTCYSGEKWTQIAAEQTIPCNNCCLKDNFVCSPRSNHGNKCVDCKEFCSKEDGNQTECHGYCRDWCHILKMRRASLAEEKNYGFCYESIRLATPNVLRQGKAEEEPGSGLQVKHSGQGLEDEDEDNERGILEGNTIKDEYSIMEGSGSSTRTQGSLRHETDLDIQLDHGEDMSSQMHHVEAGNRSKEGPGREYGGTVVRRKGSFNPWWLLWIMAGCAILLLLANGILLLVMLKQRTRSTEKHQTVTHTNHGYMYSPVKEDSDQLVPNAGGESKEIGRGNEGDGLAYGSEGAGSIIADAIGSVTVNTDDERSSEKEEREKEDESTNLYTYIEGSGLQHGSQGTGSAKEDAIRSVAGSTDDKHSSENVEGEEESTNPYTYIDPEDVRKVIMRAGSCETF